MCTKITTTDGHCVCYKSLKPRVKSLTFLRLCIKLSNENSDSDLMMMKNI